MGVASGCGEQEVDMGVLNLAKLANYPISLKNCTSNIKIYRTFSN